MVLLIDDFMMSTNTTASSAARAALVGRVDLVVVYFIKTKRNERKKVCVALEKL